MKIKPCGYRLLIKPETVETQTDSGLTIVLQENIRKEQTAQVYGIIIAIGPECWKDKKGNGKPWASEGDKVCYVRHSGKYIIDKETDEEFVVLNDEDILVIMEKENG